MAGEDAEISAMTVLTAALEPLEEGARKRVLGWAVSRFAGGSPLNVGQPLTGPGLPASGDANAAFGDFAELFDAATPKTDKEKALVAAYWIQVCTAQPNFASQSLNTSLKDLGHGVGNITDALEALKDEKPALVLQLRKSGTSKQARKIYKLTQEGAKRVQQMTSKEGL